MSLGLCLNRCRCPLLFWLWRFALVGFVAAPLCGQSLRIYHIDVEQGDATLLVAPGGKTLLVDSGKNGHGERIKAVMDQAGVTRIDYFVNTHYHEGHYGGIDDLLGMGIRVGKAFDRGDKKYLPERKRQDPTYRDYQDSVGAGARRLRQGMTIALDPEMTVTCTSSGGIVIGEENPVPAVSEKDMSLSLLVTLGDFYYFIGGDMGQATESKMAASDLALDVDVYRSNSHGSETSSSTAFLEDLNPTVVVISNGNSARRHHPRSETLRRYQALSAPPVVFQTNKYLRGGDGGNVADEFIADVASSGTAGTILVTVDADARDYTVSLGPDRSFSFVLKRGQVSEMPPEILPEVLVESRPSPVDTETSRMPGMQFLYVGIFFMVCMVGGTAVFFWTRGGKDRDSQPLEKPRSLARPSSYSRAEPSTGPDPARENSGALQPGAAPFEPGLHWERFPDSEIPEQLQTHDRHTWVRRQPGRLTSRQGPVNVHFAARIDFLINVPVAIEHDLCLSVVERSASEEELQDADKGTLAVYNKGAALLVAVSNCSDADKAVVLKTEIASWRDKLDFVIAARFSKETVSLVLGVEGRHLKQRTERMLGLLLSLLQGHPRVRTTQDMVINLKAGGSLDPGAESFRDSLTEFELEHLLDVGALEEC